MTSDLEELMQGYSARYSQQVRDVVETLSSVTTRLGNAPAVPALSAADVEAIKAAAHADEKVLARIAGKAIVKVIAVPGKLVNLVVKG